MSMQKKLKTRGILMLVSFFALLAVIFSPVFPGKINGLDYIDNMFNTISKGSSYFIPDSVKKAEKFVGKTLNTTFSMANEKDATNTATLFKASGAEVTVDGVKVTVNGDMGMLLKSSLEDAEHIYNNDGAPVASKYGLDEKEVIYNWWTAFKGISKNLTKQENFDEAKVFTTIQKKSLEPAYNYYGVEASHYKDNFVHILMALAFYVIYTLWYGFGLMYLFEGLGLKIGH